MRLKILLGVLVFSGLALLGITVAAKVNKQTVVVEDTKIKTLKLEKNNTVLILEEIGNENSEAVANYISYLNTIGLDTPIYLLLDSPGGSVIAGAKVVNAIEASGRPVHTVCLTLCASMAAIIHSYGTKRLAVNRAILMYHDASGSFEGEFTRIKSLFGMIDRYVEKFDTNIIDRSQLSRESFGQLKRQELWIDTEDALAKGLVEELVFVNTKGLVSPEQTEAKKKQAIMPHTKFDVRM